MVIESDEVDKISLKGIRGDGHRNQVSPVMA